MRINLSILAASVSVFLSGAVPAQSSKLPPKSEMDAVLESAVSQSNKQMNNSRLDEHTVLKMVTYDKAVPVFTYHYVSTVASSLKRTTLNNAEKTAMQEFHRTKTCSSQFKPFMVAYGLNVAHIFEDKKVWQEAHILKLHGLRLPKVALKVLANAP